jgi:hypothetical protein
VPLDHAGPALGGVLVFFTRTAEHLAPEESYSATLIL